MASTIIPAIRYSDARQAVDWLQAAFAFEAQMVIDGDDGQVVHAQLTHGAGLVMVSSPGEGSYDDLFDRGAAGSTGIYVVVDDPSAHCKRARAAGAEIVMEPEAQEYGGSLYTCRDLEGNVWSFGSYDPWA
ncbi:MAG: VOC family protein [Acidimicrobiales bacterium]